MIDYALKELDFGIFKQSQPIIFYKMKAKSNVYIWIYKIKQMYLIWFWLFLLVGNIEGVGFLLAAKSVFRFGELSKRKVISTTEYVLIGTHSSFTIAILTGIAISHLY